MAQAKKKPGKAVSTPSRLTHHLKEIAFLLSIVVAVYLFACLFTYHPTDPGPFSTTNSDHVQNAGRILGAWIADAFLGLTGYIAYLLPVVGRGFFSRPDGAGDDTPVIKEAPIFCLVPLCLTAFGCIVMFFYADHLYQLLRPIGGG